MAKALSNLDCTMTVVSTCNSLLTNLLTETKY